MACKLQKTIWTSFPYFSENKSTVRTRLSAKHSVMLSMGQMVRPIGILMVKIFEESHGLIV